MSYYSKLKKDLQGAAAAGIITPEQAGKVWERSYSGRTFASFKAVHWIAAAAGLFISFGLILIVASNWDKLGAVTKMGAFLLIFAAIAEAAVRLEGKPGAIPLETIWFFMPVLGIGLYAQIFNLSGDPVKPYLLWAALSAPLAVLSKRPLAAYLTSILLLATLYFGTFNGENMLALTAPGRNAAFPPAWHWALALAVLGSAVWLYPGKKTALPLGAAVVWLYILLFAPTAIALGSTALLLLAGMSLAVLWLSFGQEPDDDRAGLALTAWTAAVYVSTFFWHYKAHTYDSPWRQDTAAGAAITWLLFAGALAAVWLRKQRLLPGGKTEDYLAKGLMAASVLCAFLLFDTTEVSAKILAVIANLILAAFGVGCILSGTKNSNEKMINRGVAVITITAITRFIDIFGSMLKSGLAFVVTGLAFAALAYFINKGRKALIESVKK